MKKIGVFLVIAALVLAFAACGKESISYTSSFTMYVNNAEVTRRVDPSFSLTPSRTRGLTDTYTAIITQASSLEKVIEQGSLSMTVGELRDTINVTRVDNIGTIRISVTTGDAQLSKSIADALSVVAPQEIDALVIGASPKLIDQPCLPLKPDNQ